MKLWTGLGNPGSSMSRNRHNIGFMAVDEIARRHGFSPWRQRFRGEISEGMLGGKKIILLKPQTYMNLSGDSVQQAVRFYKISLEDITVFHDELDLLFGRLKVKRGGGAAGHNGLRSMDRCLSGPEYWRIRMGIGHPGSRERVNSHVLGDFAKSEEAVLSQWLDSVSASAAFLAQDVPEEFMTRVALLQQQNSL